MREAPVRINRVRVAPLEAGEPVELPDAERWVIDGEGFELVRRQRAKGDAGRRLGVRKRLWIGGVHLQPGDAPTERPQERAPDRTRQLDRAAVLPAPGRAVVALCGDEGVRPVAEPMLEARRVRCLIGATEVVERGALGSKDGGDGVVEEER